MPALIILVDYDNLESTLTRAGPVALAKAIAATLPNSIFSRFDGIITRLYGGWRSKGTLTVNAQQLVPTIRAESPTYLTLQKGGASVRLRLIVELADKPIWANTPLPETFVKERELRKFRSKRTPWNQCSTPLSCGLTQFSTLTHSTSCNNNNCPTKLSDVLVRDEQKMVDTLIVADIAYQVLSKKASELVVVSSDTDMWPGVLLALQAGCAITHVHTKAGGKTQPHLMNTLRGRMGYLYQQLSV